MDVASTSEDTVGHEVETEVEVQTYGTDALIAVTAASVLAAESAETEQSEEVFIFYSYANAFTDLVLTRKGDSTQRVHEAFVETVPLAATEDVSRIDKVIPDVTHGAASEAGNDSLESGTNLNVEPQREHEVNVTVSDTEDAEILDIHSNPTPVPLPEISLIKAELEAENQVEATSIDVTPIDVKVQPDLSSNEIALNSQKDIETQTQVDDTSNIKHEPIPESDITHRIESADIDGPLEDVPASNTKEFQNTTQLEPEVDLIVPEPSAITQAEAENILPRIESEGAISQHHDDTIPVPENVVASVANVEDQIVAPVDVQSEHATDELAEVSPPPNVEESPETLAPPVEPSYKSSDNEMVGVSLLPISTRFRSLN